MAESRANALRKSLGQAPIEHAPRTEENARTRTFWGKDYHYVVVDGKLSLRPGPSPFDVAEVERHRAEQRLRQVR